MDNTKMFLLFIKNMLVYVLQSGRPGPPRRIMHITFIIYSQYRWEKLNNVGIRKGVRGDNSFSMVYRRGDGKEQKVEESCSTITHSPKIW